MHRLRFPDAVRFYLFPGRPVLYHSIIPPDAAIPRRTLSESAVPNPDKIRLVKDHNRSSIVFSIARSGGRIYTGTSDFKVLGGELTDAKFEPKELYAHDSYVTSVVAAGDLLISGSYDCSLIWFDTKTNARVRKIDGAHAKWIRHLALSPDGKKLASVGDDMVCRVWDVATGKKLLELRGHEEKTPTHYLSMLYAVAWSADGKRIATGDKVGHIVVWDSETGASVGTMETPVMYTWDPTARRHSIGGIRSLAFSPDGKLLAVVALGWRGNIDHLEGNARVEIMNVADGTRYHEFPDSKFKGLVNDLKFHPSGDWLVGVGGAGDGCILFFDVKGKKLIRAEKAGVHLHALLLDDTGDTLWTAGHNRVSMYSLKG